MFDPRKLRGDEGELDPTTRPPFAEMVLMNPEDGSEICVSEALRVTTVLTFANTPSRDLLSAHFVFDIREDLKDTVWQTIGMKCMDAIKKITDEHFNGEAKRLSYGCDAQ